jgi:hypothetical protein
MIIWRYKVVAKIDVRSRGVTAAGIATTRVVSECAATTQR